jgi:DNA-directed RNA polymerase specialized sigma subunit
MDEHEKRDFRAYAIVAVARAMRESALEAISSVSAPKRIKKLIHRIDLLLTIGKTEQEICDELKINRQTFINLKSLIHYESWHKLFNEPTCDPESFLVINDLLSSCHLTEKDGIFLLAQLENDLSILELTNKQKWSYKKNLCSKLIRSGYGI